MDGFRVTTEFVRWKRNYNYWRHLTSQRYHVRLKELTEIGYQNLMFLFNLQMNKVAIRSVEWAKIKFYFSVNMKLTKSEITGLQNHFRK